MDDIKKIINKIPLFEELSEDDIVKICNIVSIKKFNKNEVIFYEGADGEGLHFVITGKVKITKVSSDGREHILNIFGNGSIFAEVTLFNNIPYPATAYAMEESIIAVISNKDMEKLLREHGCLSLELIKIMSKRLKEAQSKAKDLALHDTFVRTGTALLKLGRRYGKISKEGIQLDLQLSRQELADLVGTTRETVSRALSTLKNNGLIKLKEKTIIIVNEEKLEDWIMKE